MFIGLVCASGTIRWKSNQYEVGLTRIWFQTEIINLIGQGLDPLRIVVKYCIDVFGVFDTGNPLRHKHLAPNCSTGRSRVTSTRSCTVQDQAIAAITGHLVSADRLVQLYDITVRVLEEGDDAGASFHRAGLAHEFDTLRLQVVCSRVNVRHLER